MTIDIDDLYPLQPAQVAAFREHGYIRLRSVLSPETLAYYGREITRLTLELNEQQVPLAERSTYDRAFLQVMNLWERSPLVGRFVMGQRLARIAAALLEVPGVRLYHDQSLYKEPGGGLTPAHADQYYWPLASDRTITAWIPLQAVPLPMGAGSDLLSRSCWPLWSSLSYVAFLTDAFASGWNALSVRRRSSGSVRASPATSTTTSARASLASACSLRWGVTMGARLRHPDSVRSMRPSARLPARWMRLCGR